MAKKLSFDALPAAVEKILEILTAEGSEHTALPELVQRMTLLEKKMDYLQKTVSPDRTVMDTQTVCRVLKLRPKAVSELATSGVLPSRTEGRRTLFYEDAVVKYFMTQPAWKEATAPKPAPARRSASESAPAENNPGEAAPITREDTERQLVDIYRASEILGRSPAAIYQLTSKNRLSFHKEGPHRIYFFEDHLHKWVKDNPPRQRKKKSES